jgi:Fe-S cluster assembly ATPase SufC
MLEIKNLVVQIEDNRILNGLNLTVNDGEVAAIMGLGQVDPVVRHRRQGGL